MWSGNAKVEYYDDAQKVIAVVSRELANYYFSLIPKWKKPQSQRYCPHITIVRSPPKEVVAKHDAWRKHDGEVVAFEYSGEIKFDGTYYYLEVYSDEIGVIRRELGLPIFRDSFKCYHLTIGNIKENRG